MAISLAIASIILSGSHSILGQEPTPKIGIKNFGCINPNLYRGAQPTEKDFQDLASIGVKTVIDLRREGVDEAQQWVESAGMKFIRIPMSDSSEPPAQVAEQFLKIVNDPANQPVFFHCRGGRHRTGAMGAIYRITQDGWTADQAYDEMKKYEFKKGMGHGAMKDFVYEYYTGMTNAVIDVK